MNTAPAGTQVAGEAVTGAAVARGKAPIAKRIETDAGGVLIVAVLRPRGRRAETDVGESDVALARRHLEEDDAGRGGPLA